MTHNNPTTAPLLGLYLGRVRREQVVDATRALATLQKENGERKERRLARWKYTIRRLGVDAVKAELRGRFGIRLDDAPPAPLPPMRLHLGWNAQRDGRSWYGLSVENGRLKGAQRRAVRAAVERLGCTVKLTPQQDLLLCDVADRAALERILDELRRRAARSGVARARERDGLPGEADLRARDDGRRERAPVTGSTRWRPPATATSTLVIR